MEIILTSSVTVEGILFISKFIVKTTLKYLERMTLDLKEEETWVDDELND